MTEANAAGGYAMRQTLPALLWPCRGDLCPLSSPATKKGPVMALSLSKKDARKLKRLMAQPIPCLLCHTSPPTVRGIFKPDHPELWGGPSGKERLIVYAVCTRCYGLPDLTLKVEARLMRNLVGRGN